MVTVHAINNKEYLIQIQRVKNQSKAVNKSTGSQAYSRYQDITSV